MTLRPLLLLVPLLLGCSNTGYVPPDTDGGGDRPRKPSELRTPSTDELRSLRKLANAIVVGVVDERIEKKGQLRYRVRVREVLSQRPGLASGDAYKVAAGKELRVDAFLFTQDQGNDQDEIGPLGELDRYIFFLAARPEKPGEWFNLDDAAGYPLPEAQETVEALRRLAKTEPLEPKKEKAPEEEPK